MMEDFFKWIVAGFAGGAGIWLLIKSSLEKYAGAFLEEKGKNLATKQDIGGITKIVEDIKHENNVILEEIRGKYQMRLAAIDKRLEAYQKILEKLVDISSNIDAEAKSNYKYKLTTVDDINNLFSFCNKYNIYITSSVMSKIYKTIPLMYQYLSSDKTKEKTALCGEIQQLTGDLYGMIRGDVELPAIGEDMNIITANLPVRPAVQDGS